MDYTIRVLCKCRDYGFRVYMDPHQDTVSFFPYCRGFPMRRCLVSFFSQHSFLFSSGLGFLGDQEHRTGLSPHAASTHVTSPQPKPPLSIVNTPSHMILTPPPSPLWSGAPTTADYSHRPCLHYFSPDATLRQIVSSMESTSKIIYRITTSKHVDNLPTG